MTSPSRIDTSNSSSSAPGDSASTVLVLQLGQVEEDPHNPRRGFDEAELEALAETMRESGVLQPIWCARLGLEAGTGYASGPDGTALRCGLD